MARAAGAPRAAASRAVKVGSRTGGSVFQERGHMGLRHHLAGAGPPRGRLARAATAAWGPSPAASAGRVRGRAGVRAGRRRRLGGSGALCELGPRCHPINNPPPRPAPPRPAPPKHHPPTQASPPAPGALLPGNKSCPARASPCQGREGIEGGARRQRGAARGGNRAFTHHAAQPGPPPPHPPPPHPHPHPHPHPTPKTINSRLLVLQDPGVVGLVHVGTERLAHLVLQHALVALLRWWWEGWEGKGGR
jgi:hypothetical protein